MASMARELPTWSRCSPKSPTTTESTLGWCDDQSEFEFGLDVLLDGLERRRSGRSGSQDGTG